MQSKGNAPNAAQKRFLIDLAEMHPGCQIHHCVGRTGKHRKIEIGHWFIIAIPKEGGLALIAAGGANAIPWNLVCHTIPAVIIGGQIGPWLQGRIAQRTMEKAIAILFGMIGVAMMWIVIA